MDKLEEMLQKLEQAMDEDMKNPDGYFAQIQKKHEIREGRFKKFKKWLNKNDFNKLLIRLCVQNGDEHRDRCYKKGYEPYPTAGLQFVLDYISSMTEKSNKKIDNSFEHGLWKFKGYWFQLICGQGCHWIIYNDKSERIFSI